ncbi:MAG: hypothetical protein HWN80_08620 [Candidatus Lokiarchaeota archaeon]|nr:hypothetical protein [Candidatus Lokiarchaeota archaeon]
MLKNELDKHNIEFQILNLDAKIPTISSIILTTSEDIDKLKVRNHNNYFVYSKKNDFEKYLIKIIAAYRISYKKNYSTLTFSIDPGKKLGLMIFLDDYYLDSYYCFGKIDLLNMINMYVETFQEDNPKLMDLNFKLGRGVLNITFDLVKQIYRIFQSRKNLKVFLIDEFRSSKIRFSGGKTGRKFSKDEISALILAFRNGIIVNQDNYGNIFEKIKNKKLNIGNVKALKTENHEKSLLGLKDMVEKVLQGEFTLSSAMKMLKNDTS